MSKISNIKKEVPCTKERNDKDYLNDILTEEKNLSNNYSISLNEMSNKVLYKKIFTLFKDTKLLAREAYDLCFLNGWYTLDTALEQDILKARTDGEKDLKEL